jgi:spore germination protein YaaH
VYTQYIKFHSNRAVHQAYSIAVSQVLPILYISNTEPGALEEIQTLMSTMCANGFQKERLIKIISNFLNKGTFPGIQVDIKKIVTSL